MPLDKYTNEEFSYSRTLNSDLLREQRLNLRPFIKVRVRHTDLFIFLLNNQTKLLRTLCVQLWSTRGLCTNTLSLPLALSAVLGGVTVGFFLAAPASVRASAPRCCSEDVSERLLLHPQLTFSYFLPQRPREQSCRRLARRQRYWGSNPRRVTAV